MVCRPSRRTLLSLAGLAPIGGGFGTAGRRPAPLSADRRDEALRLRVDAAQAQAEQPETPSTANGDETALPRWIAVFTKGLPHDQSGEVEPGKYESLLHALDSGKHADFEQIQRGSGRRLVSPQAAFAFCLEGGDPHRFACPAAPSFATREGAAEMVELYWQALCRDIPFAEYNDSPLIAQAAADLWANPRTVFRGPTPGNLDGPYLSQFLLKPIPYHSGRLEQQFRWPVAESDFMTTFGEWLQIQTGVPPWRLAVYDDTRRYLRNGRDLAEWVHYDVLYQAFLNAALILMKRGPENVLDENRIVLAQTNPYRESKVQDGFVTFGPAEVTDWLGRVSTAALKAAWWQKWLVHRRLRPEAFGGRVHQAKVNAAEYPIHPDLLKSPAVQAVFERTGSYLLPQAYPEGAPLHPAYPSGHAAVAGACSVVLKALFDESALIPDCVHPSADGLTLLPCPTSFAPTVGAEVNKLAFNIAMGRNWAGIHYRSDAMAGLRLGEEVGISILQDLVRCVTEDFQGFAFTRMDGSAVRITRSGEVTS